MCCRNVTKAEAARDDVLKRSGTDVDSVIIVQLDLADLDNVGSFRARYDAAPTLVGQPVHMLILNAGVMALNKRELTKQGIEAQMGTNVVGHFKFAACMIDLVKAAPKGRIVWVSSGAHHFAKRINFKDFNRDKRYAKWDVYSETKAGNLLLMMKMNRLFEEKGLTNLMAVGCHP
jgi:NAD(P)-dependent dehydrogenase (short-subunit alcohol dehydrogenase family)